MNTIFSKRLIPKYLVELSPTVYITQNAWYGPDRNYIRKLMPGIIRDIDKLEETLGIDGHHFIFRYLARVYNGYTYPSTAVAFIDPRRRSYDEVLHTIVHEALHLKQVQDGYLKWEKKSCSLIWKGTPYSVVEELADKNYETYRKLPWEIDVENAQDKIFRNLTGRHVPAMRKKP